MTPIQKVPVIKGEVVTAIRELADRGWGSKAIARELGVARNTVRRYRRQPFVAGQQIRAPRRLTADVVREAQRLYAGVAEAMPSSSLACCASRGVRWDCGRSSGPSHPCGKRSGRLMSRRCAWKRPRPRSCRLIAGRNASTSAARRLRVPVGRRPQRLPPAVRKSVFHERQDDWREGIAAAFAHFGGVTATILGDNGRALVLRRDWATGTVQFHPVYLAFC